MKGNNTLVLNQSTMIEALQLWLNSEMREGKAQKVDAVKMSTTGNYDTFEVVVTDPEATE